MRGMDRLIAVRRQGLRPAMATLHASSCVGSLPMLIGVDAGDVPELADLRALRGLWVNVEGFDAELSARWGTAAKAAGAETVIAFIDSGSMTDMQVMRLRGADQ